MTFTSDVRLTILNYVAGKRAPIQVESLQWSDYGIAHMLAHGLTIPEAASILDNDPLFFENVPSPNRIATHVIVGRSDLNHSLMLFVSELSAGHWYVHTGYRNAEAHRILEQEGRL
jgi:hypothetical protein